jgi:hypothetical protein
MRGFLYASVVGIGCALVAMPTDADACGGCFHPVAETGVSVITDHRMVFKLSKSETILWDQVRFSGNPEEFAWVLPVRDGARVELSRDEWIGALDLGTRTTVTGPERFCNGGGGSGSFSGGGCGSSSETLASRGGTADDSPRDGGAFVGNDDVQVLEQSVIGPYQAVTIRATGGGQGIDEWLIANGFAIPEEVRPTVDAYTAEKFDFIALRLRPGQGVNAMRPVRVVTQGADPTLPLRMVAAGVGAKVGLTLWVISEGRYHPQNFPDGIIDEALLTWDAALAKSNLADLQSAALASNGGRSWITEAAIRASSPPRPEGLVLPNPVLSDVYRSACATRPSRTVKCTEDELPPPDGTPDDQELPDAGVDASSDDAGLDGSSDASTDASLDASAPFDAGAKGCTKIVSGCDGFDDYDVAMRGIGSGDAWITRLRADLPVGALSTDLKIEAAPSQDEINPQHHTEKFNDPSFDPCAGRGGSSNASDDGGDGCACRTVPLKTRAGTWFLILGTAIVASRIIRQRRVH